jgi:hypothetical protein
LGFGAGALLSSRPRRHGRCGRAAAITGYGLNKKRRWGRGVFSSRAGRNYFETDFLNMRSIFSLVASHEACAAWAADSAWLAVLCAPLAAVEA